KAASDNPTWNIDLQAGLHIIKLSNTWSAKPNSRDKKLIDPRSSSTADLVSCLIDIQPKYFRISNVEPQFGDVISAEDMIRISVAVTGQQDFQVTRSVVTKV
ncbi:hypothetical protein ACJMK2_007515, partial [Sinanodonta woodiana]